MVLAAPCAFIHWERLKEGKCIGGAVLEGQLQVVGGWQSVAIKQPAGLHTSELERTLLTKDIMDTIETSRCCPNVVPCLGWSATQSGRPCLIMKLMKQNLHTLINDQSE